MSDSILTEAVRAVEEAVRAEVSASQRATPVDEAEVAALVAMLPVRAAEGKVGDACASHFLFLEWDPRDHKAAEVSGAAHERLVALGLTPVVEKVRVGLRGVPGRILVDYADLGGAARREELTRRAWVTEAQRFWARVGGEGAGVTEVTARSGRAAARFSTRALAVPLNDASPFRLDFLLRAREREVEVEAYWTREVAEVVAFVESVVRPVRWTAGEVEAAWSATGGGFVSFSYGMFDGAILRQCAVIEFRRGDGTLKLAVEDVRTLSATELVLKARGEGVWEVLSAEAPARPDMADERVVAGAARDRELGIGDTGQHDAFVYVAPPGPPRVHFGDTAPVPTLGDAAPTPNQASEGVQPEDAPKGPEALPEETRLTPVQALTYVTEQRAGKRASDGRFRKAVTS